MEEALELSGNETEDESWTIPVNRKRKGKEKESDRIPRCRKKVVPENDEKWVTAAKIDKLCEILDQIRTNNPLEKVIVFSQVRGRRFLLIYSLLDFSISLPQH